MMPSNLENLCNDLQLLAQQIPLTWGNIQNDATDSKLKLFDIKSYEELERKLQGFAANDQQYFRRRWFLYNCATCDELLFCENSNVTRNPHHKDKVYDIEIDGNPYLRFDLKGTVVPKQFRNNVDEIFNHPQKLVDFFYEQQSTGVRIATQNRLFIIHHSYKSQEREMQLRCMWKQKKMLYNKLAKRIMPERKYLQYNGKLVMLVFIFEQPTGAITYRII